MTINGPVSPQPIVLPLFWTASFETPDQLPDLASLGFPPSYIRSAFRFRRRVKGT